MRARAAGAIVLPMESTTVLPATEAAWLPVARVVACECGRPRCADRFRVTERELPRARRQGGTLVSHSHLPSLAEVVGVADAYLVLAGRHRKEHSS
jgi:hypothetical protein